MMTRGRFERGPLHKYTFPHVDYDGCHFCLHLGYVQLSLSQTDSLNGGKAGLRNKLKPS